VVQGPQYGGFGGAYFAGSYFGGGPVEPKLVVHLKGNAATQLGATIGAIQLAEKVMAYWDAHPLK
jgi:hypothetical protein